MSRRPERSRIGPSRFHDTDGPPRRESPRHRLPQPSSAVGSPVIPGSAVSDGLRRSPSNHATSGAASDRMADEEEEDEDERIFNNRARANHRPLSVTIAALKRKRNISDALAAIGPGAAGGGAAGGPSASEKSQKKTKKVAASTAGGAAGGGGGKSAPKTGRGAQFTTREMDDVNEAVRYYLPTGTYEWDNVRSITSIYMSFELPMITLFSLGIALESSYI